MGEVYGDPPPAFTVIDTETGRVTEFYDELAINLGVTTNH